MIVLDKSNGKSRRCFAIMCGVVGNIARKKENVYLVESKPGHGSATSIPSLLAYGFDLKWLDSQHEKLRFEEGISSRYVWLRTDEITLLNGSNQDYLALLNTGED